MEPTWTSLFSFQHVCLSSRLLHFDFFFYKTSFYFLMLLHPFIKKKPLHYASPTTTLCVRKETQNCTRRSKTLFEASDRTKGFWPTVVYWILAAAIESSNRAVNELIRWLISHSIAWTRNEEDLIRLWHHSWKLNVCQEDFFPCRRSLAMMFLAAAHNFIDRNEWDHRVYLRIRFLSAAWPKEFVE